MEPTTSGQPEKDPTKGKHTGFQTWPKHSKEDAVKQNPQRPPLISACLAGNRQQVAVLLKQGDDANVQETSGGTPLMAACEVGEARIIELLLREGANVHIQEKNGWSSLMIASGNGHRHAVNKLLQAGANVNTQSDNKWTSLMIASKKGHIDVVRILLSSNADVNRCNTYGWSALMFASRNGHIGIANLLLADDAEVNMQDLQGWPAVMLASQNNDSYMVKLLLKKGAQVNMQTNEGATALMTACFYGYPDVVQVLLEYHADLSIRDVDLDTALDHAVKQGHMDIVATLLAEEKRQISTKKIGVTPQVATVDSKQHANELSQQKLPLPDGIGPSLKLLNIDAGPKTQALPIDTTVPASVNGIAAKVGTDLKQLDQPCDEDHLLKISRLIQDWVEYAELLKITPQEVQGINTDLELTYAMKCYSMLKTWYRKSVYTEQCHYRVLVEASCHLGYADVAGKICNIIKESTKKLRVDDQSSRYAISKDLILFKREVIGGGAFGTVFKGELKGQLCAIKVLHLLANQVQTGLPTANQTKQDSQLRFQQECEYLETFNHPNVVRHLATRTHPETNLPVLALELMDCNLRELFSSPSRKIHQLSTQKSLCSDIISAVAYIHTRHIVHRDLCSDNILLNWKGDIPIAKVCDFGMSKIIATEDKSISLPAFGHRGYLPPEATDLESSRFDSSFDIFSFGAIMIQIFQRLPTIKDGKERTHEIEQIDDSHPLKSIALYCLETNKENRPSALQLKRQIKF